jgi:chromosome segregation ATPase
MDERKRTIGELEFKKKEALRSLGAMYEDFGEVLFSRVSGREEILGVDSAEYLKLRNEIIDSEGLIQVTKADTDRLKELEGEILVKEQEYTALTAEIHDACAELGREAVGDEAFSALLGGLRQQVEQVVPKLDDAQARLAEIENRGGEGFFGWIGKNTQQAVYKTLAVKHQGILRKLYTAAGERLAGAEDQTLAAGRDLEDAVRSIRDLKENAAERTGELEKLREDRRRLGSSFGAEGGPLRRIQNLEKHIARIRADLKVVYRRVGELAAAEGRGERFSQVLMPEDSRVLEMAGRNKELIAEYSREIEKLKTAITIDNEKAEIEKMERAITDQKQRIAAAEGRVEELNRQIGEARDRIEELSALL